MLRHRRARLQFWDTGGTGFDEHHSRTHPRACTQDAVIKATRSSTNNFSHPYAALLSRSKERQRIRRDKVINTVTAGLNVVHMGRASWEPIRAYTRERDATSSKIAVYQKCSHATVTALTRNYQICRYRSAAARQSKDKEQLCYTTKAYKRASRNDRNSITGAQLLDIADDKEQMCCTTSAYEQSAQLFMSWETCGGPHITC